MTTHPSITPATTPGGGGTGDGNLTVGTSTISGGTPANILFDNNGTLGELVNGAGVTTTGGTLNVSGAATSTFVLATAALSSGPSMGALV